MSPSSDAICIVFRVCATVFFLLIFVDFRANARKSTKISEKKELLHPFSRESAKISDKVGRAHLVYRSGAATALRDMFSDINIGYKDIQRQTKEGLTDFCGTYVKKHENRIE